MAAETAKKRSVLNIVMIVVIVVIVIAGIGIVGNIQGWFGGGGGQTASGGGGAHMTTSGKLGYVNIQRAGVSYTLEDGTQLQADDDIETLTGSSISIDFSEGGGIDVNANAQVVVEPGGATASAELMRGQILVDAPSAYSVTFGGDVAQTSSAVYSVDLNAGSKSVDVFAGSVTVGDETVSAGESLSIITGSDGTVKTERGTLAPESLNDYVIGKLKDVSSSREICFGADQLDSVLQARQQEAERAQQESVSGMVITEEGTDGGSGSSSGGTTTSTMHTVTIEIRCDNILANIGNLSSGKEIYVPQNGVILTTSTVAFNEGDTVYDILDRACAAAGIQMEASWTPAYNSYYIEGINNLYQFDCGELSGWTYKVNGWVPNYGASSYTVQDGDTIVWDFTCDGGRDTGGTNF